MYRTGAVAAWTAFGLFILAMLTDVFDGRLARRDPDRSPLGNYLDPVADKVLLMSVFICLAGRGVIPVWMVLLLVGREFVVDGVRSAGAVQGKLVGSNWMGKTKTLVQTFAISFALLGGAVATLPDSADWGLRAAALFYELAWWVTLVVAVAGVIFALVFVYWNRRIFYLRRA